MVKSIEFRVAGAPGRVRFPLVAKMLVIISAIVIASAASITALATYFFAEDSRARAEDQNLAMNELVAFQAENEVRSSLNGALQFLDAIDSLGNLSGVPQDARRSLEDSYFARNPAVAYVGVTGGVEATNRAFFAASELDESGVAGFLGSNAEWVSRATAGESLLLNASPWIGVPAVALAVPYRVNGEERALAVVLSSERLQDLVGARTASESFIVASDGVALAHSDVALVERSASLASFPSVSRALSDPGEGRQFRYEERDGSPTIGAFRKVSTGQFMVVTSVPVERIYAAAYAIARRNLYLTGVVLVLSALAIWFFSRTLTSPVLDLVRATGRVEAGEYETGIRASSSDEIGLLAESFARMGRGLAERERIKEQFGKFVNREIAERAMKGQLALGGERKVATIFFSDIRSFTAMSERMAPESVVEFLNEYMTLMVDCVERTGGVVDKFIGDAIMAVWGAPVSGGSAADDAFRCVTASLEMRAALVEFNRGRGTADRPRISVGCGVNTGPCLAGQIGSSRRMEYTVIGDSVNLASRIEALNKPFGTDILVSEHTYGLIHDRVIAEPMPLVTVKGKASPLRVYAIVNAVGHDGPKTLAEARELLGIERPGMPVDAGNEERKYEILPN